MPPRHNWQLRVPDYGCEVAFAAWAEEQVAKCEDLDFAQRFQRACPVDSLSHLAYLHRFLDTPKGELLAGIRFKGGDVAQPFVDVLAWTANPHTSWCSSIANSFAKFTPKRMRLGWASGGDLPWPNFQDVAIVDQYFVAGIAKGSMHETVTNATDLTWHEDFEREFGKWQQHARLAGNPVAGEVHAASTQEMQSCLDNSHVVVAHDQNGRFLGVAAIERQKERSFDGWCMIEEFVALDAQGQGLGAQLQRSLMSLISGELLWGNIDRTNSASLATARKCGREVVETWWFVDINKAADDG